MLSRRTLRCRFAPPFPNPLPPFPLPDIIVFVVNLGLDNVVTGTCLYSGDLVCSEEWMGSQPLDW
ncbi:hypothetical protein Hanom_Chr05g00409491 [Helianthus anomalus]